MIFLRIFYKITEKHTKIKKNRKKCFFERSYRVLYTVSGSAWRALSSIMDITSHKSQNDPYIVQLGSFVGCINQLSLCLIVLFQFHLWTFSLQYLSFTVVQISLSIIFYFSILSTANRATSLGGMRNPVCRMLLTYRYML